MSDALKQKIALLEGGNSSASSDTKLPPVLGCSQQSNTNTKPRYIVKFAHIPSEAFYCTATTWRELCIKTEQVWGISRPFFTFTTVNALDRQVTFRLSCAADFESVWSNPDAPVMQSTQQLQKKLVDEESHRMSQYEKSKIAENHKTNGGQFFGKQLIAHDHRQYKNVAHSADYYQYSIRPFVSTGLLSYWPVRYVIRHTMTDEVMFVTERESQSWGFAVQKCQAEWSVLRPLFRYIDDIEGERTIISIVSSEDFQHWFKRRRLLWPELLVFEHAAPALLDSHKQEILGVAGKYLQSDHNTTNNNTRPSTTDSNNILPQFEGAPEIYANNQNETDPTAAAETEKFLRLSAGEKRLMQIKSLEKAREANATKNFFPLSSNVVAPLAPDTNRDVSYYPSKTSGFPIANAPIDRNTLGSRGNNTTNNSSTTGMNSPRSGLNSRDGRMMNGNQNYHMMSASGLSLSSMNNNNNNTSRSPIQNFSQQQYSNEANALLSSFRKESLQTKTEWEKVQEERQYQAVRAKHVRELERALMMSSSASTSSPVTEGSPITSGRRRGYL